jgi:iron(III) transport system substrate-binding protein
MRVRHWKALVGSAAAAMAAAGPVWAQTIEEICATAATEPPLMWYSSQDPGFNAVTVEAFSSAYPDIKAEFFRLPSGALAARYASERDAGVVNADLISLSDANFVAAGIGKGWIVQFAQSDLPALANIDAADFSSGVARTGTNVAGITFNSEMVSGGPILGWEDLLRPEFKGKIALADPRNVPSFVALFRILREEFGDEYLTKLAEQDLNVVSSAVPGTQQVAAGEFAIVFPNTLAVTAPLKAQGAPVDFMVPSPTTGVEYSTMLSEGADSPNAAKCFFNFLYTEEGQRSFNSETSVPVVKGLSEMAELPDGYQDPKVLENGEHVEAILKLLKLQ